ncbi:hypothetical protein BDQ94DRAFT_176141 [Aspergillus welwitschiae]|uniref:Uncharacterized protein n=1 Tax=Aspergillus welwitschiae TaxID=1341132 RepID=A0A3F3PIJ8_9EURO|nr:hypothetical protein BDQ94DRAFT_176141 [Aspergillus welwitschiae]RDH26784.1 hypothetical protein BDQ94DRAFT_176141 [Aspergillus welwitschiae]
MPKVTTRPRARIRATTRKTESHSGVSDTGSIQTKEPVARPPQQPLRSLRRPYMRPQISGSGSRDVPSASSSENHGACLATVETLERENEALRRDKKTLSERLESAESGMQELMNNQHRCRQGFSERQATQQLVDEMQHTVAGWHQRLRSPAGLPERVDPAAWTTGLPATTAVPDMWPTQEDERGAFGDDHDVVPDSGHFAQLFQLHQLLEIILIGHQIALAWRRTMALGTTHVRLQNVKNKNRGIKERKTHIRCKTPWKRVSDSENRQEDENWFFCTCLKIFNNLPAVSVDVSDDLNTQHEFEPEISPMGS